jgi:pre-mRNA 3'-end-processing factor FIP1
VSAPAPSKGEGIDRPSIRTDARYTAAPSLTTEYTPMQRGGVAGTTIPSSYVQPQPLSSSGTSFTGLQPPQTPQTPTLPSDTETRPQDDSGVDPSTLPPVTAPPSHPTVDPTAIGILDGRSIFEVDLTAMAEKPWRRPGSDISDWFNYGFDEISWEAYCYRRRDLGEMANVLKTNVIVRRSFFFVYYDSENRREFLEFLRYA